MGGSISITSFGALLIIPYLPIYLNSFLYIGRGVVSTILTFAPKNLVPAYSSLIMIVASIVGIGCGLFTRY